MIPFRPRILLAADNADMRDYLQRLLEPSYEVQPVSSGRDALITARAQPPDLVLSDVMVPLLDGVELLRQLRNDPRTRPVPVILLSARAGGESRVEGLQTGADDYLIMPFSAHELRARVGAQIELARVRHESEQRVTHILESISDAFQVFGANWRITYMNPACRAFFSAHGVDPDSMIGRHFFDDLFPDVRDSEVGCQMLRAMNERVSVSFESYYQPWDTWSLCRFDPLPDGGLANYFTDISQRKRAEEALRRSEERYRSVISQVREFAIFSTDERGVVTTWNEGCQYVLGYAEGEFLGLDTAELFTPEDRADGIPTLERRHALESGTARIDRWMVARGGRRFFGMGATAAVKDPSGRLLGFSTVIRDLTQMKVTQDELAHHGETLERLVTQRTDELEKTTERLRLSQRMASLGTLAAGLGHDMGNLLLPLDIRLNLLLQADLPPDLHEHVLGIQKCARYLQRLSKGLGLLATDPSARTSEVTELGAWWSDVSMVLSDVLPRGVRLERDLPREECWVGIGRTGLTQAVFNLVKNAADALKAKRAGCVRISVEDDPSSPWVVVSVTDDGPGMTEEVMRRCVEPYFSTKTRGESTGMGLAFVHGLVTGVGGSVEIDSALGRGTTISLLLPRPLPDEGVTGISSAKGVRYSRLSSARTS